MKGSKGKDKGNKGKKRTNKKKYSMKGGDVGTSGDISTLVDDIYSLTTSVVNTIVHSTELVVDILYLPYEFTEKIPYKYPATPGSEL